MARIVAYCDRCISARNGEQMTLTEWLNIKNRTYEDLAEELGVSRQAVHKWTQGGRVSPDLALKLEKISNGDLSYRDLTTGSAA